MKGGCVHLSCSAGTTSVWELSRMVGRDGSFPVHLRRMMGFPLMNSMVWDCKLRDLDRERRKVEEDV